MISVVLAGGKGLRLWPESTIERPKQLCDFFGQGTLLAMTLQRLKPLGEVMVICDRAQEGAILQEMPHLTTRLLSEPLGRNTAPAVGRVLVHANYSGDEIMGIFPADHFILDSAEFLQVVQKAEAIARKGFLVTIGIPARRPETGYGYIEKDQALDSYRVQAFHEKPDKETARTYIEKGNYYWNAGIFVASAKTWRALFRENLPDIYHYIQQGEQAYLAAYEYLPNISIDYGIAEKCRNMAVVEGEFGWSDVGSWNALIDIMTKDRDGNAVYGGAVLIDSKNCLVRSREKKLVLLGVEDMVVVETDDIILICPRDRSQDVKVIGEQIKGSGKDGIKP